VPILGRRGILLKKKGKRFLQGISLTEKEIKGLKRPQQSKGEKGKGPIGGDILGAAMYRETTLRKYVP